MRMPGNILLPVCLFSLASAQTIHVRGKISNGSNQAIPNATVELLRAKQTATSGADGMYSLGGSTGIPRPEAAGSGSIRLDRGALVLDLDRAAPVRIGIYDAKGQLLDEESLAEAAAGSYRFGLSGRAPSGSLLIVKASVGGETKTLPCFAPSLAGTKTGAARVSSPGAVLAKVSAVVDTLKVTAAGYAAKRVEISAYDTTVNVTLNASQDRWGGPGNPPGPSAGCGKPLDVLKSGKRTIAIGGAQREFIIDIPADYKPNNPYRLFFCFHWFGGSDDSIASGQVEFGRGSGPDYAYYGLKRHATLANAPAIFIAPQGNNNGWGGEAADHAFFDGMLASAKNNLCIDTTRVFSTGFSFGSMFTYSLSTNHQKQLRAGVGIAPANWNIWLPTPLSREPIAWMQTTGMSDGSCKWINDASLQQGAKFIGLQRGVDNGCNPLSDIPTAAIGSKTHLCQDFTGCKEGYPVKVCTFDGAHIANVGDGGTSNVGKDSWIPVESWKFFTQF